MRAGRNGEMFYTADDVNLDRVHAAMSAAGRRARPLRVDQLGNWAWVEARRNRPRRPAHDYGPHDPSSAPTLVDVARPGRDPDLRPMPSALIRQRERINTLAYQGAQRWKADP